MAPKHYLYISAILIIMALIPLSAPLGLNLEYEYALFLSMVFLIGIPLAAFFPQARRWAVAKKGHLLEEIAYMVFIAPLLFSLPGVILLATRVCPCASSEFTAWMLVQALPCYYLALSFFYGINWGIAQHGFKRWHVFIALFLLYFSSIVFICHELYVHPQKRFISLIFGYLHGPIYDEWLPLDGALVQGRILAIAAALIVISLMMLRLKASRILMVVGSSLLFFCLARNLVNHPSIGNDKALLDQELPDTLRAPDFVIHYRKNADQQLIPSDMRRLFFEVQFHLVELERYFPPMDRAIEIYIYPDVTSRKLLFGSSDTDVTDIHTPSIHLVHDEWSYPTLRHELVHAVSSPFAFHGLGFHPNMAFTEGLAMVLAPEERPVNLDNGAAAILLSGRVSNLSDLLGIGFYGTSPDRAYTLAGSFIQFLIGEFGFEKVLKIYAGSSWDEVLPESRQSTTQRWRERIMSNYDSSEDLLTESLFRYSGILHDICPHSKASLVKDRGFGTVVRLRQPLGWSPEEDYWPWRAMLDPSDLHAQMVLWKKDLKKLAAMRILPRGRLLTFYGKVKSLSHMPPQTIEDVELGLLASDILQLMGDPAESQKLLKDLSNFGESTFPGYDLTRQIQARLLVEQELPPLKALEYRKYLAGWNNKSLGKFGSNETFIGQYLYLRNREGKWANEMILQSYLKTPLPSHISSALALEWYKTLGQRFVALGAYLQARESFVKASAFASSGMIPILEQYQRQAAFMLSNVALNKTPLSDLGLIENRIKPR